MYCKFCGSKIDPNTQKCKVCGATIRLTDGGQTYYDEHELDDWSKSPDSKQFPITEEVFPEAYGKKPSSASDFFNLSNPKNMLIFCIVGGAVILVLVIAILVACFSDRGKEDTKDEVDYEYYRPVNNNAGSDIDNNANNVPADENNVSVDENNVQNPENAENTEINDETNDGTEGSKAETKPVKNPPKQNTKKNDDTKKEQTQGTVVEADTESDDAETTKNAEENEPKEESPTMPTDSTLPGMLGGGEYTGNNAVSDITSDSAPDPVPPPSSDATGNGDTGSSTETSEPTSPEAEYLDSKQHKRG